MLVEYDIDKLPKVSKAERDAVAAMTDDEIDCSDIPEITDFSKFIPFKERHLLRRKKVIVKVEPDVYEWLKKAGDINNILRSVMKQSTVVR
ncbi:hypothetical protein AGMMS50212_15330 [Spirochaetia bacterium]|nr:hypothetical protein AGMMS50212_15330 [Spirochaetia bacterium]